MTLDDLNALDRAGFTIALGAIFEHSPWIAERASQQHPFADADHLMAALLAVVEAASIEEMIALIRAHPDLAGKAARTGDLTEHSTAEQAGAGLDRLSDDEFERFHRLNDAYKARFGEKPSLFSMQGYDTGRLIIAALEATGGDTTDKVRLQRALETVTIESPRGPFKLSKAHNPVQNIYVREVVNGPDGPENRIIALAAENLEDPGTGCPMM